MTKDPAEGKLGPKWEGPYQVVKCHAKEAYHLISTDVKSLPRAWNAENLKKYITCDLCSSSIIINKRNLFIKLLAMIPSIPGQPTSHPTWTLLTQIVVCSSYRGLAWRKLILLPSWT
jgi:hypothetical protein